MAPYLLVIAVATLASIIAINSKRSVFFSTALFVILIVFTGLRYQVGYDWIAYERYFNAVDEQISITSYFNKDYPLNVELLYYLLNNVVKTVFGSFDAMIFIISLLNISIIHYVFIRIDKNSLSFSWLIYIIIALIPIQFNIIRQSLASSFVCLSILYAVHKDYKFSALFFVISLGFHISSIIFLPLIIFYNYRLKIVHLGVIVSLSSLIFLIDIQIVGDLLSIISNYLPSIFSQKADAYSASLGASGGSSVSLLTYILVMMHFIFAMILYLDREKDLVNIAFNLTIMILISHLLFKEFPSIWNRVMAVSLVFQIPCLWIVIRNRLDKVALNAVCIFVGAIGLTINYYKLSRFEAIAFVPYHSYLQVVLFDDYGNGRQRTEYAIRYADEMKAGGF